MTRKTTLFFDQIQKRLLWAALPIDSIQTPKSRCLPSELKGRLRSHDALTDYATSADEVCCGIRRLSLYGYNKHTASRSSAKWPDTPATAVNLFPILQHRHQPETPKFGIHDYQLAHRAPPLNTGMNARSVLQSTQVSGGVEEPCEQHPSKQPQTSPSMQLVWRTKIAAPCDRK